MRVLLYTKVLHSVDEKRLCKVLRDSIANEHIEICRSTDSFIHKLCQPTDNLNVTVLLCCSEEDLSEICSVSNLLHDIPIILILPNRDEHTIAQGHRLYPRFVSYIDSDLEEVGAVLNKMFRSSYKVRKG